MANGIKLTYCNVCINFHQIWTSWWWGVSKHKTFLKCWLYKHKMFSGQRNYTQKKKMWVKQAKNGHCIIVILMSTVLKTETSHNSNRSPNDCMESQPLKTIILICSAVITSDITLLMVLLQVHKLHMKWYSDLGDHGKKVQRGLSNRCSNLI